MGIFWQREHTDIFFKREDMHRSFWGEEQKKEEILGRVPREILGSSRGLQTLIR